MRETIIRNVRELILDNALVGIESISHPFLGSIISVRQDEDLQTVEIKIRRGKGLISESGAMREFLIKNLVEEFV